MSTWKIDTANSSAQFKVKHLGVAWVKGSFSQVEGTIEFNPEKPEEASVEATIAAESVWTGDEKRDRHLRSEDFFDAENHPDLAFKSSTVEKKAESEYEVRGELTMRGKTNPVTLAVTQHSEREIPGKDGGSETRAGFTATTTVNRHDYGISWDAPAGDGETVAGGDVEVTIEGETVKVS